MGKLSDHTPFSLYKRNRISQMLAGEDFAGKEVLEVGIKSGANLKFLSHKKPKALFGTAGTPENLEKASSELNGLEVELAEIQNGRAIPFPRQAFDLVFTDSYLQHITNKGTYFRLIREVCRASDHQLILIESTEVKFIRKNGYLGRPLTEYIKDCQKSNFRLKRVEFINIEISEKVCRFFEKYFNPNPQSHSVAPLIVFLQNLTLPITKILDRLFPAQRNLTKMVFEREQEF